VTELYDCLFNRVCLSIVVGCLSIATSIGIADRSFADSGPADQVSKDRALTDRIAKLIEQLGSDYYATRRQAQDQLKQIGVPALDQLRSAILHSDPQIATLARLMFRSSFVNWTNESDPLEVRKLLEHYGTGDLSYRAERIARLASIKGDRGLPALLRIAFFEVDGRLSRSAALLILDGAATESNGTADAEKQKQRWQLVHDSSMKGQNQACQWLTEFARSKIAGANLDASFWNKVIEAENQLLRKKSMESIETSNEFVRMFSRFVAEEFIDEGMRDEALKVGRSLLDIEYHVRDRIHQAHDLSIWALEKGLPELVIEQSTRPWMNGVRHTRLDYMLAESYQRLEQLEKAEESAERAFNRGGMNEAMAYDRKIAAEFLNYRRCYRWAEREYRAALEITGPLESLTVTLVDSLQKMLVDGMDHEGAVEVMKPLIERFEKEPAFAREIDNDPSFNYGGAVVGDREVITYTASLRGVYLHNRAIAKIKAGNLEDAKQDLRDAWKANPDNVDVAITMWKNRADEEWNRESDRTIEKAIQEYQEIIPTLERELKVSGANELATYEYSYANTLNTYAWVLANTDRDLETALECSQQACRIAPTSAACLDTLARCYFKVGKLDDAIRYQKEAVAIEPWSREIVRSLTEYEAALPKTR
jgi:tetratricopeptide (TPR) repeat protein